MKKIHVGIDISKEKCNLCYRSGLKIVREEEISNEVKALKKAFKAALKALDASMDDVLICAEYTGRYIYPLTVACQELDVFLWMDDPTRIKNYMGLTRGKNDAIDAARIAEYAFRYSDKAVRYAINMIAITGGFTRFQNARQFCSFAGLTPYRYDSGTSVRSKAKISKRANQTMKALLHMSAVNVATRMKAGEYKDYYERKLKEGKHVMCILNVLRAKLVHRMFSVIKRDTEYTKEYKPAC